MVSIIRFFKPTRGILIASVIFTLTGVLSMLLFSDLSYLDVDNMFVVFILLPLVLTINEAGFLDPNSFFFQINDIIFWVFLYFYWYSLSFFFVKLLNFFLKSIRQPQN